MGRTEQGCNPKPPLGADRALHQNPDVLQPSYELPSRQAFTYRFCNCVFNIKNAVRSNEAAAPEGGPWLSTGSARLRTAAATTTACTGGSPHTCGAQHLRSADPGREARVPKGAGAQQSSARLPPRPSCSGRVPVPAGASRCAGLMIARVRPARRTAAARSAQAAPSREGTIEESLCLPPHKQNRPGISRQRARSSQQLMASKAISGSKSGTASTL